MLKMWQNYVDRYNKFQWWLSGVIYGFYIGSFVQKVRRTRRIWSNALTTPMTYMDATMFTIEVQFGMTNYDSMVSWLNDHGYELVEHPSHTGFCTKAYCVCEGVPKSQLLNT